MDELTNKEREFLCNYFRIKSINLSKEICISADYDIDWVQVSKLGNNFDEEIKVEKKELYELKVEKSFIYMLLDFIKYNENISNNKYTPVVELHKYFNKKYKDWYTETVLCEKYPTLKEMMKEYEIMKALIVDEDER